MCTVPLKNDGEYLLLWLLMKYNIPQGYGHMLHFIQLWSGTNKVDSFPWIVYI